MNSLRAVPVLAIGILCFRAEAQPSREIQKTLPLRPDGNVVIDTYKGSIRVEVWQRSEIEIVARITADGSGRDDEEAVEDTRIDISAAESSVRVRTDYDQVRRQSTSFFGIAGWGSTNLPLVDYSIRMPAKAALRIKDYKSATRIHGLASAVGMNTYKGTVEIRGLAGSLELETYKGDADIEVTSLTGSSSVETYKGTIILTLPRGLGFELVADIGRRGELDADLTAEQQIRSSQRAEKRVRAAVNGGGPELRLKTYRGTFHLRTN